MEWHEKAADDIIKELSGRDGFDAVIDQIDDETLEEIKVKIEVIIREAVAEQLGIED